MGIINMRSTLFAFALTTTVNALVRWGACPRDLPGVPDFSMDDSANSYLGDWYEVMADVNKYRNSSCVTESWAMPDESSSWPLSDAFRSYDNNRDRSRETITGGRFDTNGTGTVRRPGVNASYRVLATDYTSYALVWHCINRFFGIQLNEAISAEVYDAEERLVNIP